MKRLALLAFGFITLSALPETYSGNASALRYPWESYEEALERNQLNQNLEKYPSQKTALGESQLIDKLDFSATPFRAEKEVQALFKKLRDERFISTLDLTLPLRRSTWLYPADGCWARAALASQRIEKWGIPSPAKLFVFGPLKVKSANLISGEVSWWYHVAPVYVSEANKILVLDPALESQGALELTVWLSLMGDPKQIRASLCSSHTFKATSPCDGSDIEEEKAALADQKQFLKPEWDNLTALHRNPAEELGEKPPWANNSLLNQ